MNRYELQDFLELDQKYKSLCVAEHLTNHLLHDSNRRKQVLEKLIHAEKLSILDEFENILLSKQKIES